MSNPIISVIIPTYNEQETIISIIEKILKVNIPKQIIVVNDFSKDRSSELVQEFISQFKADEWNLEILLINNEKNMGRSNSILNGVKYAKGNIIIPQDADLEYDPNDYHALIEPIVKGATNIVYGSRFKNKKNKFYSHFTFYLGNKFLTWLFNILFFKKMTDIETCYKVIKKDLLVTMEFPEMKRFEFCPYLTTSMTVRKEKIIEVPVNYYPRSLLEGKKAHWKDAIDVINILFETRFKNLKRIKSTENPSA